MDKIIKCHAIEILDSRGNPTLQVTVATKNNKGTASVPSGASTGAHEAVELRDGDSHRYGGKGVLKAISHVNNELSDLIVGKAVFDQATIDQAMILLDGTSDKHNLGANAILGVSLAVAKAAAATKQIELYEYLGGPDARLLPCPMMNILNGGVHADNGLSFQEFMIRPVGAPTFSEAIRFGAEVVHKLKSILKKKNYSVAVGDEGGFAPPISSNEEALDLILQAIEQAGFKPGKDLTIALDPAASEFYQKGQYIEKNQTTRNGRAQIDYLNRLISLYPIDSIEDGLDQNDWEHWRLMTEELGGRIQIVGDDLFVTNTTFLQRGIDQGVANAILIKPNQIGTLTETVATIHLAQKNHYKTVLSHRSGETEDTTIADLSVAYQCGQIKTGSLCRSERTSKYNRLLTIEAKLGKKALFYKNY